MDTLAERLVWARTRKELTQEELAKKARVAQGTIGNLEAGIRKTARKISSIARALDVSTDWLADNKGEMPPDLVASAEPFTEPRLASMRPVFQDEEVLLELYRQADSIGQAEIIATARSEARLHPASDNKPGRAGAV